MNPDISKGAEEVQFLDFTILYLYEEIGLTNEEGKVLTIIKETIFAELEPVVGDGKA